MKKTILEIFQNQYNFSLKEADALIRSGKVLVNSEKIFLPSLKFDEAKIKIEFLDQNQKKYVSRAAYKLLAAIDRFNINVNNKVCLDIGSSTGGFVQVLLNSGAKKVYAIDSGTNQLDYNLRVNKKVSVHEKTNLKVLTKEFFNESIEFVSCDVSFISLKHVFNVCNDILSSGTFLMALIKPQFEASSKYVEIGGYVNPTHHEFIINKIILYANKFNFKLVNIDQSPILGGKSKNIEYISLFVKE